MVSLVFLLVPTMLSYGKYAELHLCHLLNPAKSYMTAMRRMFIIVKKICMVIISRTVLETH